MCRSYPTSMSSMTRWKRLLTRRQNSQVHPSTLSVRTLSQSCATQWWISTSGSKGRWDTSTIFIYCFCSIVFCLLWCWWDDVSCQDVTDHHGDEDGGEGTSSQQEVSKTFRALLSPAEYWILKSHNFPVFFLPVLELLRSFSLTDNLFCVLSAPKELTFWPPSNPKHTARRQRCVFMLCLLFLFNTYVTNCLAYDFRLLNPKIVVDLCLSGHKVTATSSGSGGCR